MTPTSQTDIANTSPFLSAPAGQLSLFLYTCYNRTNHSCAHPQALAYQNHPVSFLSGPLRAQIDISDRIRIGALRRIFLKDSISCCAFCRSLWIRANSLMIPARSNIERELSIIGPFIHSSQKSISAKRTCSLPDARAFNTSRDFLHPPATTASLSGIPPAIAASLQLPPRIGYFLPREAIKLSKSSFSCRPSSI